MSTSGSWPIGMCACAAGGCSWLDVEQPEPPVNKVSAAMGIASGRAKFEILSTGILHPPAAIAGAGAVARALGRSMHEHGTPIVAVASRSRSKAEAAAAFIGTNVRAVAFADIPALAARVLVAVSDDAITPVARALADAGMRTGLALHTCGAKGPDALEPLRVHGVACGMMHPLQTIVTAEQGLKRLHGITFGVAGDEPAVAWASSIVAQLGSRAMRVPVERLSSYHAGAVMASNAIVAVVDAAAVLLASAGIEPAAARHALEPLCREALDNVLASGARSALTGPIARGDATTVAAHLDALAAAPPTVAALYQAVARHLVEIAKARGLADVNARALESALDATVGNGRG